MIARVPGYVARIIERAVRRAARVRKAAGSAPIRRRSIAGSPLTVHSPAYSPARAMIVS